MALEVILLIDGWLLNPRNYVQYGSLSISQAINDEADTARFTFTPATNFIPLVGHSVVIGIGTEEVYTPLFGGQVLRVTCRRVNSGGPNPHIFYDVECIDYLRLLDAHLVTTGYRGWTATAIMTDIVTRWVAPSAGFSTAGIKAGMPVIDIVPVTNERPSTVLRRVANLVGGGFYVDAAKVVHAWDTPAEPGGTNPAPLTNTLTTLKAFQHTYDMSQVRTRVVAEGMRTETPAGVPVKADGYVPYFPIDDPGVFVPMPFQEHRDARVGTQQVMVTRPTPPRDPALNVPGTTVFAAVSPPTLALDVVDSTFISPAAPPGLLRVNEQVLHYKAVTNTTPGHHVFWDIPPAGAYCGLQAPIGAGTAVTEQPYCYMLTGQVPRAKPLQFPDPGNPENPHVPDPIRAQPVGTAVVLVVKTEDTAAQTFWKNREGGDGVHEHLVQDGRWNVAGCTARGLAELELFKDPILTAEWVTEDLYAAPGRAQAIALTFPTLSATLTILTVQITFPKWDYAPLRRCSGSSVKVSTLQQIAVTDSR